MAGGRVPVEIPAKQGGGVPHRRFQDLVAGGIAHAGQDGRFSAHAGGVAGVGGLDHCAGVGGEATGARGGDTQGHEGLLPVQAQCLGRGRCAAEGPHQARRMVARCGSLG